MSFFIVVFSDCQKAALLFDDYTEASNCQYDHDKECGWCAILREFEPIGWTITKDVDYDSSEH
jgi:hypothetical protein